MPAGRRGGAPLYVPKERWAQTKRLTLSLQGEGLFGLILAPDRLSGRTPKKCFDEPGIGRLRSVRLGTSDSRNNLGVFRNTGPLRPLAIVTAHLRDKPDLGRPPVLPIILCGKVAVLRGR